MAFVSLDKTVAVTVDGRARVVPGLVRTVGDVLDAARIDLGPHDSVSPDLGAVVDESTGVAVRQGHPVALSLDGRDSPRCTRGAPSWSGRALPAYG